MTKNYNNYDKQNLGNLQLCIAPKGSNPDNVVTYPFLDMEMYVRNIISTTNEVTASFKVTHSLLKQLGIDTETLFRDATEKTQNTIEYKSLFSMMMEMMPFLEDEDFKDDGLMTVITNKSRFNGAVAIYFKNVLKEIADKYKSDLLIFPSSIHEIIVVPANNMDLEDAKKMVREINYTTLSEEERLSDNAYIFHRDTMEITW